MYYRILKAVNKGGPIGSLCQFDWLDEKQVNTLLDRGIIAPLQAPPLHILNGWKLRAERLSEIGIIMVNEFLEADPDQVAKQIGSQRRAVERWQMDLLASLTSPVEKKA